MSNLPYCVPGKPPKYMVGFFEYVQKKQRKGEDYGFVKELVKKHWESFHKLGKERKPRGAKKERDVSENPEGQAMVTDDSVPRFNPMPLINQAVNVLNEAESIVSGEDDPKKVKRTAIEALKSAKKSLEIGLPCLLPSSEDVEEVQEEASASEGEDDQ